MNTDFSSSDSSEKQPERYIRTFEGDVNTFQSGGIPDLALMKGPQPSPAERLIEMSPLMSIPQVEAPEPVENLIKPTPLPLPPKASEDEGPAPIETYSGDFRERMKKTNASTATVLAAEQDATPRFEQQQTASGESTRSTIGYVVASVGLVLIGGIGAYVAYLHYSNVLTPVPTAESAITPIFVDTREQVSGTGATLLQAIKKSVGEPLGANSVRLLSLSNPSTADTTVFSAISTNTPGLLLRNVNAEGSMAGVVNTSSGQSPFFILSVGAYNATFSGMLSWEPVMQNDLSPLYPLYPAPTPDVASSTATTTLQTFVPTGISAQKSNFRDEVVSNHDVRIYRDAQNRSILLYGYWNQQVLVIARDPAAFTEILARLATSYTK